jgi:hypothetical protein
MQKEFEELKKQMETKQNEIKISTLTPQQLTNNKYDE